MFAVSIILHALLMVTVYVLQGVIFPYLRLNGLIPLLLPIICTGIAVRQGRIAGGVSGLFAGILCDISFNEPVGLFMLVLTLTGILVGSLTDTVLTRGFGAYICCCITVLALAAFIQMFSLLMFVGVLPSLLLTTALWQTVYSLVFAFPTWFILRSLGRMTDS